MRILLVDDEVELVSAMAERLNMRGVNADYVTCGKSAVEKAQECHYDVMVVDLRMPGMDGIEVMKLVKEISPDTGFVFLTGYGSEEQKTASEAAGANCYLMKPVKISLLMEKIDAAAQAACTLSE
ncbi:Response regulator receiver domain-containing protein [Desulfatibacillum alkenivorans DSM 16219]|jgi:DNA-binding response OmpR family regulator|uniref:Response regulator receiver domain-containing protein n=1 Tax=Desulfatibacillum alkenivorans DSM 16219 TaxID=1121393 RepID=A0A1M6GDW8_9BACT|nr:response regulator [Desulfatibacillum alkenivorans]SHJ08112.1 Response regulator receiver domain-containing protein [Desulfatibacillum alkenivorans DSM 16219]